MVWIAHRWSIQRHASIRKLTCPHTPVLCATCPAKQVLILARQTSVRVVLQALWSPSQHDATPTVLRQSEHFFLRMTLFFCPWFFIFVQPFFAVNSTARMLCRPLLKIVTPSTCAPNSKHRRTRPHVGPWCVKFTHTTRLQRTAFSFYHRLTTFVSSLIHMTYVLELGGSAKITYYSVIKIR